MTYKESKETNESHESKDYLFIGLFGLLGLVGILIQSSSIHLRSGTLKTSMKASTCPLPHARAYFVG